MTFLNKVSISINNMSELVEWQIYCITEHKFKSVWYYATETPPTKCPYDTAHVVNLTSITTVNATQPNIVEISEVHVPPGFPNLVGRSENHSFHIIVPPNSTGSYIMSYPFPVAIHGFNVLTDMSNKNDIVNIGSAHTMLLGTTMATISIPVSFVEGTIYSVDDMITYDGYPFSCIATTDGTILPTDETHWQIGIVLSISNDVSVEYFARVTVGLYIYTMTNVKVPLGRVTCVDSNVYRIYVSDIPSQILSGPLQLFMEDCPVHEFVIGLPTTYNFRAKVIGARYIPKLTPISITYTNKSLVDTRELGGWIEMLH